MLKTPTSLFKNCTQTKKTSMPKCEIMRTIMKYLEHGNLYSNMFIISMPDPSEFLSAPLASTMWWIVFIGLFLLADLGSG